MTSTKKAEPDITNTVDIIVVVTPEVDWQARLEETMREEYEWPPEYDPSNDFEFREGFE